MLAQSLTEMSTRDISLEGKDGRCVGLILPPLCAHSLEILGASTSWIPKDMSRPVMGWLYLTHYLSMRPFGPMGQVRDFNSAVMRFVLISVL